MVNSAKASDFGLIEPVLKKYKNTAGSLITVLQEIQDIYGYLPEVDMARGALTEHNEISADGLKAKLRIECRHAEYGCRSDAELYCGMADSNGSEMIGNAVYEALGIRDGETTEDGLFTLKTVACLGCCSLSPVMMINSETYGSLTPHKVKEIIAEKIKEANAVV